jgi:3'-phosphoadenosine 5'-phosphosulfate sulfotransferase (PAPS reductase)/FAD synthetase
MTTFAPAGFEVSNPAPGEPINIVGLSGGKDSLATVLHAMERNTGNLMCVFNDTGMEHPITYEYIAYLKLTLPCPVHITKADFSERILNKRQFVIENWKDRGVSDEKIASAVAALIPTGNPFLDLCKWKGRFPSTKARFCTTELKVFPFHEQVLIPMLREGYEVIKWLGVRAAESPARAKLGMTEYTDPGYTLYRPLLHWSAEQCFEIAAKHGYENNPLYTQGMGRVGCMPCIMANKKEVREISNRFPEVIDRLEDWETEVARSAKKYTATFFPAPMMPIHPDDPDPDSRASIRKAVEWSRTVHGGNQYDIFADESPTCSSVYGLCE